MIKFNDQFSIEGETHNWILHETYVGKSKGKKEQKLQHRQTYHGTLEQVARAIINRLVASNQEIKTVQDLISALDKTEAKLTRWLETLEKT